MLVYRWNKNSLFSRAESRSRGESQTQWNRRDSPYRDAAIRFILPEVNSWQFIEVVTVRAVVSGQRSGSSHILGDATAGRAERLHIINAVIAPLRLSCGKFAFPLLMIVFKPDLLNDFGFARNDLENLLLISMNGI